MAQRTDFGVLYGQKTTDEDSLLIYSSYEDAKASPKKGDFIVLSPRNESGTKFLARVEAEIYDEDPIFRSQDKTLVAVHYARVAERELSERDKQKMFSYTYKVLMLGTFTDLGTSLTFTTAVRKLPQVAYHARHLNQHEVACIINQSDSDGVDIGYLCIGEEVRTDTGAIRFSIGRLRTRRTMVFAQSGYGKTNLVKVLLYHAIRDASFGKLVFDLNGEYVLDSNKTVGLGTIDDPAISSQFVYYTDRDVPEAVRRRGGYAGPVRLDMVKDLSVGDILNFGTGFSEVMKSFLLYLDQEGVSDFVANMEMYISNPSQLHIDYPDFFSPSTTTAGKQKEETSARKTIAAIKKRVRPLLDEKTLHKPGSTLIANTFRELSKGKTVVIDLSLKDSIEAGIISTIIVRQLFEHNKANFTGNKQEKVIEAVVFVEEAQNVLSGELVRTNANPFVRCAKEGRKFGLGLVAITQRPSAISDEIRTQAENFFALHMGNSDDIAALVKSNIHFDGVIAKFIQRESIIGNVYMISSDRAFVVPLRVHEFEKLVKPDNMMPSVI